MIATVSTTTALLYRGERKPWLVVPMLSDSNDGKYWRGAGAMGINS